MNCNFKSIAIRFSSHYNSKALMQYQLMWHFVIKTEFLWLIWWSAFSFIYCLSARKFYTELKWDNESRCIGPKRCICKSTMERNMTVSSVLFTMGHVPHTCFVGKSIKSTLIVSCMLLYIFSCAISLKVTWAQNEDALYIFINCFFLVCTSCYLCFSKQSMTHWLQKHF